jgi:putative alpha-1,2-mannosidase
MLRKIQFCLLAGLLASPVFAQQKAVDYVNPIIGTNGMGHTFPGACVPFGLIQLSPDTDTIPHNVNGEYQKDVYKYCAGYQYSDPTIVGFSHTHLSGTGHSDLGDMLIMPTVGELKLNPGRASHPDEGYRSRYSHSTEHASAGYYEVELEDYKIKAQLTATPRVGIHKYTYPSSDGRIVLDLNHGIYNYDGKVLWSYLRVENDTLLTGYRITNGWARTNYTYFAISFSQPIKDYGYVDKKKPVYTGFWRRFKMDRNFPEIGGRAVVSYFNFDTSSNKELVVKVALSHSR